MLAFFIALIGTTIGLIGWFSSSSVICLIIGTIACLIEDVLEEDNLTSQAKTQNISAFVIGAVIAVIRGRNPWYIGGLIAINVWNAIISVLSIGMLIRLFSKK